MSEEIISDVSDAPTDVSSEAPAPAADEATPVQTADDKWAAIDFSAIGSETSEAEPAPPDKPDDASTTEVVPPEGVIPEGTPDEEVEEEELPELSEIESAGGAPLPLSRKIFREVESKTLTPLRNPDVPITDVIQGFAEFHPERWTQVEKTIGEQFVYKSAEQFPNEWLEAITGLEGITVDRVKELAAMPERGAAAPEAEPIEEIESYLTEYYGEDWKDPRKDHLLGADDVNAAKLARQLRVLQDGSTAKDTEQKAKIEALEKQINDVMPQIETVQKEQQLELERLETQYYTTNLEDYRSSVEKRVLPKIFSEAGLDPSENDTDTVKAMKAEIRSGFESKYGDNDVAEFDRYLSFAYPKREMLGVIIQRVDKMLVEEGKLLAKADKKASSVDDANRLRQQAAAIRNQANTEQATLAVLHLEAAREFVKSKAHLMQLLQDNATQQKQLGMNGNRVEIVGSSTTNGQTFAESLKDKSVDDKWDAANIFAPMNQGAAR